MVELGLGQAGQGFHLTIVSDLQPHRWTPSMVFKDSLPHLLLRNNSNIAALAQALAEGFCIRPGCVTDIANRGDPGARLRLGDERRYEQTQGERDDESNSAAPP